jgi:predicted MFS family arabinose efflux permease
MLDYLPDQLKFLPLNDYSSPALLALVLILLESLFLWLFLPETRNLMNIKAAKTEERQVHKEYGSVLKQEKGIKRRSSARLREMEEKEIPVESATNPVKAKSTKEKSIERNLSLIHFAFIFVFSGMEFTLTFLTFDRFEFSNSSQGRLLGFMGLCSALFQGVYVRRVSREKVSDKDIAVQGIFSCGIGLILNGLLAYQPWILYLGCFFLSFTSGTVVNSLVALSSLITPQDSLGESLGIFRSFGQLGRALGPIFFCTCYWIFGSKILYAICGIYMLILGYYLKTLQIEKKKQL